MGDLPCNIQGICISLIVQKFNLIFFIVIIIVIIQQDKCLVLLNVCLRGKEDNAKCNRTSFIICCKSDMCMIHTVMPSLDLRAISMTVVMAER